MSLSYTYEFTAPASVTAGELEAFLRKVEYTAKSLGFDPTTVLNVPFDTRERRDFSRRLGGGFTIQSDGLKGATLPDDEQIRNFNPHSGECRLVPTHGVVLVVTDEAGCETCFGFFKYPEQVMDIFGKPLAYSFLHGNWIFRNFVDSPDRRYRQIVEQFKAAGYVQRVTDEFA